jgi:hypothetical protein
MNITSNMPHREQKVIKKMRERRTIKEALKLFATYAS